jgi:low affinity Fe/Cu permease
MVSQGLFLSGFGQLVVAVFGSGSGKQLVVTGVVVVAASGGRLVVIGGGPGRKLVVAVGVAAVLLLSVASLLLLQQRDHFSQAWLSFCRVTISSSARQKISRIVSPRCLA